MFKKGRGKRQTLGETYADNKGNEYSSKLLARISSFGNFVTGCISNGFPIVVPKLWYLAWAFYPFFFIRKDIAVPDARVVLNHERIHIRQQRDVHLAVSIPLLVMWLVGKFFGIFDATWLLPYIPFIPTLLYIVDMVHAWRKMVMMNEENITLFKVRMNTCFEREAVLKQRDMDYLLKRDFLSIIKFIL